MNARTFEQSAVPQPVRTYMGTYYFDTFEDAAAFAVSIGAPVDRLIHFGCGVAIQWHVSGPYAGPDDMAHPLGSCAWCGRALGEVQL